MIRLYFKLKKSVLEQMEIFYLLKYQKEGITKEDGEVYYWYSIKPILRESKLYGYDLMQLP